MSTDPYSPEAYRDQIRGYIKQRAAVLRHSNPPYFLDKWGRFVGGIQEDVRRSCPECSGLNAFALSCPDGVARAGCIDCGHMWEATE